MSNDGEHRSLPHVTKRIPSIRKLDTVRTIVRHKKPSRVLFSSKILCIIRSRTCARRNHHRIIAGWPTERSYPSGILMTRYKTRDRSVDCIWTRRLSASVSLLALHFAGFLPAKVEWPALKRSDACMHYPSLVRFISGGSRIRERSFPLLPAPRSSDVIPWNHRGGVFSCVIIDRQGEPLSVALRLPRRYIAKKAQLRARATKIY